MGVFVQFLLPNNISGVKMTKTVDLLLVVKEVEKCNL